MGKRRLSCQEFADHVEIWAGELVEHAGGVGAITRIAHDLFYAQPDMLFLGSRGGMTKAAALAELLADWLCRPGWLKAGDLD